MSNIEKLKWIPKLLDAYVEMKKVIDAQQQKQGAVEAAPEGALAVDTRSAAQYRHAASRKRPVKRRTSGRPVLHQQVRETRRQLARLEWMQQQLRDMQERLDRQLVHLEKQAGQRGRKPARHDSSSLSIFTDHD